MNSIDFEQACKDYKIIENVLQFWINPQAAIPDAKALARAAGMQTVEFDQLLYRWAGIDAGILFAWLTQSFVQHSWPRAADIPAAVSETETSFWRPLVFRTHLRPSSIPSEASADENERMLYGVHPTPFGPALIGLTGRGIGWLSFETQKSGEGLKAMQGYWHGARWVHHPKATRIMIERIFAPPFAGTPPAVHLHGTPFQIRVWRQLCTVPSASSTTYSALAKAVRRPRAIRAAATSVGKNPISYLIPCHRVWRKNGGVGGYRWGITRKYAMMIWEMGRQTGHSRPQSA